MSTQHYQYRDNKHDHKPQHSPDTKAPTSAPTTVTLTDAQTAGHGDHWKILTQHVQEDVPRWLKQSIDTATMPRGLHKDLEPNKQQTLLISGNNTCHINQILTLNGGKPSSFINAYPCVGSPYGAACTIDRIIVNQTSYDAVLRLVTADGSVIYAYDQLYAINHCLYRQGQTYHVNLSGWAYTIKPSQDNEVVRVEDPEAIRYHRAFNDIVANNGGTPPDDIEQQIQAWQPDSQEPLAPVEINLGNMCAYLFGETLGQEDEAWCQGQVLGKHATSFMDQDITVFDVAILREPDAKPLVIRLATSAGSNTETIEVNDYIQANIWLQAAIYRQNQDK